MWKREQVASSPAESRTEPGSVPERRTAAKPPGERATIGRSITIRGEVTGNEDLLIQGQVDGSVNLKQHSVTVGPEGEVKADIIARVITVEGTVEGNLNAEEQVVLRSSARVQGDISAARVMLDDGAYFRGGVEMGDALEQSGGTGGVARTSATRAPEAGRTPSAAVGASAQMTGPSTGADKGASTEEEQGEAEKGKGASHTPAQITR